MVFDTPREGVSGQPKCKSALRPAIFLAIKEGTGIPETVIDIVDAVFRFISNLPPHRAGRIAKHVIELGNHL